LTWAKVSATYLTHLKVLRNRWIRCICKISKAAQIRHSCKIFQIYQIYEYELGKFMYKIVHNFFPSFSERHNYPTSNNLTKTSSTNL